MRFAVVVSDGHARSAADETIVLVQNRAPWAAAGPDQVAPVGDVVALDPYQSSDPDGDPNTTTWFQTSGPPVTLATHPDGSG
jgi:hypothetical protein